MALADPIKEALQVMLGLTHNHVYGDSREVPLDWLHGFTPRALLQPWVPSGGVGWCTRIFG